MLYGIMILIEKSDIESSVFISSDDNIDDVGMDNGSASELIS